MGCTSSRHIGNDASPPARATNTAGLGVEGGANASSSSQAIVGRAGSISNTAANARHAQRRVSSANSAATPSDGRPNHPLRAPSPVLTSPPEITHKPWTQGELRRQREAFFDTRVTGSAEAWAAFKLVCDMLRSGDLEGAQNILDATGLTCPTGWVVAERHHSGSRSGRGRKGGVYDDKGVLYDVPGWIVSDPEDVIAEQDEDDDQKDVLDEKSEASIPDVVVSRGEAEGTSQETDVGEIVKVRARMSGGEKDVVVSIGMEQKVGVLVDKIRDKANVKRLKLMHLGKMLADNDKLSETNWTPGHVLNAFVFE